MDDLLCRHGHHLPATAVTSSTHADLLGAAFYLLSQTLRPAQANGMVS